MLKEIRDRFYADSPHNLGTRADDRYRDKVDRILENPLVKKALDIAWDKGAEWKDRMGKRKRVVQIEVLGGVAECTSAPEDVEVEIIDHDNENA